MNSIDFSKAPEGATHYAEIRHGDYVYYKTENDTVYYWERNRWLASSARRLCDIPVGPRPIPEFEPFTSCEDAQVNSIGARQNSPRPSRDIPECATTQQPSGSKHDSGKPVMSAVPPNALLAVAKVLTFGANKYGRDNWQQVENLETRYMDATLRHINAYQRGEQVDPESGESHLSHAVCSLMFILEKECGG